GVHRVLVEVVAQVEHQVDVLLRHVPVRGVVAVVVRLAGHGGQPQTRHGAAGLGSGTGAARGADPGAGAEPVVVGGAGDQAAHVDTRSEEHTSELQSREN